MVLALIGRGLELLLASLLEQLTGYLLAGWGVIILAGSLASVLLVLLGLIYWFTGYKSSNGRRMVVGGIILFIVMQWLALNPPWQLILG